MSRNLRGWKKDAPDHRDWMLSAPSPRIALPDAARVDMSHVPVFDQLDIGSCTANASCSAVAYLDGLDDGQARVYSRLFLYARTRQWDLVDLADDAGSSIRDAFKVLHDQGVCLEEDWPYGHGHDRFYLDPGPVQSAKALDHQALFYYRCPSLRTIRASIAHGFPVVAGFDCPLSIFDPYTTKTGDVIYPSDPTSFDGGHAILLIGYDDDRTVVGDRGAFRFRNSWGAWGEDGSGDGWLPYKFFEKGHAHDPWSLRAVEL